MTVYLAYNATNGLSTLRRHRNDRPVNLLIAYPDVRAFLKARPSFNIRRWCLDSGAFSAHNSGLRIGVEEYTDACRSLDACEIFGLDVIGDWKATQRNLEYQWARGVRAIPTYHYGSPDDALRWCCEHSDKIALGGVARMMGPQRYEWARRIMARIWPKRVHAFGMASWDAIRAAPFHSVDASSWQIAPGRYGQWCSFKASLRVRATTHTDYWAEVCEYFKREDWARARWSKELAQLEAA